MTSLGKGSTTGKAIGRRHLFAVGTATYQDGWGDLPGVVGDVDAIIDVLRAFGYQPTRGFEHGLIDPGTGVDLQERLLEWAQSDHASGDTLVVYHAGHGVNEGSHYLVCHETAYDLAGRTVTALPTSRLIELAGNAGVQRLLVILDTCYA